MTDLTRRTRIKVCGITQATDAEIAARAGADAIGFVFYRQSPRFIEPSRAAAITAGLPPFVTTVGLFVDATSDWIETVLEQVAIDCLQFHGDESPASCRAHGRPYIKAVRMRPGIDLAAVAETHHEARGLLLDSYRPGTPGGTGTCFDWAEVPEAIGMPIILAGGLDVGNVTTAIGCVRPWAVDVSSGVEHAPGCKDPARIASFVAAVRAADDQLA